MKCCDSSRFVGCFDSCNEIDLGLTATQAGAYQIDAYFLSGLMSNFITFSIGDPIIIPNIYNEFACIKVQITLPDGNVLIDAGYDCFEFKNIPNITR
jgi:hypothetical protein